MFKIALSLMNQPFPVSLPENSAFRLRLGIAVLVYLFLLVFKPFDLADCHPANLPLVLTGYGVISFLVQSFFEIVIERKFPGVFSESRWTVGKAILWVWCIIFFIAIANMLYFWALSYDNLRLVKGMSVFVYTFLVGVFPFGLWILGRFSVLYHKYKESADELIGLVQKNNVEAASNFIRVFQAGESKDVVPVERILFIESAENYILIHSSIGAEVQKRMLRSTLGQAEESLVGESPLVRCHRSYIVNLAQVTRLVGNAQGYKLQFDSIDKSIPVSRKYEKPVVEKLQKIKGKSLIRESAGSQLAKNQRSIIPVAVSRH
jgi:hypothetical protein